MSDQTASANVTEGSDVPDHRAEQVASIIFDAIRDKVATKADVDLLHAEVVGVRSVTTGVQEELVLLAHKADVHMLSTEAAHVREEVAHLRGAMQALERHINARIERVERQLLTRLGGLIVVVGGVLFAALRYLPALGHGG